MAVDADLAPGRAPLAEAIAKRRTFAIISHPDAGKTTLTEKLLLAGGAIHLAGEVRTRGDQRRARSDWMKIEQARGISVTTSVMTFERDGHTFNLLDTPGHEDFSEDTYRTLTAVDSAVMVIDAAKGIEERTRKLFEVCRLRDVPIVTFVNKMDREAQDPFALMDEIAETLALDVTPMTWPAGMGQEFRGCLDLERGRFRFLADVEDSERSYALDDPALALRLPAEMLDRLREESELVAGACPPFSLQAYREGHLTPVYFGSALRNFGTAELLGGLARLAPAPRRQPAASREVAPDEPAVTGFVFKVQANMDPRHRDRVAFLRLCSGRFRRGMRLHHVQSGKGIAVGAPIFFFAKERELAEEAVAGDIIGVPNHGTLRVGDVLSEGEPLRFTGIPDFAPEILMRVRLEDPMRGKHLKRALLDLAEEGVMQVFRPALGASWIVGVIGQLQLDVLAARIAAEYAIPVGFEAAPYDTARWVLPGEGGAEDVARFEQTRRANLAHDRDGQPVFLARNSWELGRTMEEWPGLRFTATRERA